MRSSNSLLGGALALAASAAANSDLYDFGNIPLDHVAFGPGGMPPSVTATSAPLLRRQASSSAAAASGSGSATVSASATSSSLVPDAACTNGPLTRDCWSNGFSIATDFDTKWPTTGQTKTFDWTLTNTNCNPDGHGERPCMLVNNQFPGPTLEANWGDMISVTIHNNLDANGTSIHWHGIRQLNTNGMDGTNGLTECPIPPGYSETYTFQATQFGTSWYHSHYSSQYGDGVSGPIVIHGPASANYDIDLGPMPLTDWYYTEAFIENQIQNNSLQANQGPPPPPDTILINGTNGLNGGPFSVTTLSAGRTHLLRLINTGLDNSLRVSVDGHQLTVITSDFVPIHPVTADSVMIGVGQRYDVIINATDPDNTGNYWMRAGPEGACQSANNGVGQAIIRYDSASGNANPSSTSTATDNGCSDPGVLTPYVPNTVGSEDEFKAQARALDVNLQLPNTTTNNENIITWGINLTAIDVQWDTPTLEYVATGNTTYPITANLIELPNAGIWVYWIIQEVQPGNLNIYHPMHLHGHDFYVLGSGLGTFNTDTGPDTLTYQNPTRRDTVMLPAGGWVVLAFPTDNPGAWLLHCHIAWHISQGLGVQFLESKSSINIPGGFASQCSAWDDYDATSLYKQEDSGL